MNNKPYIFSPSKIAVAFIYATLTAVLVGLVWITAGLLRILQSSADFILLRRVYAPALEYAVAAFTCSVCSALLIDLASKKL